MEQPEKIAAHQVKEGGIFMWSNRVALHAWICLASILGCPDGVAQQVVPMQDRQGLWNVHAFRRGFPRAAQLRFHGFMAGFNWAAIRCFQDGEDESLVRSNMLQEKPNSGSAQTDGEISYYTYYFGASVEDRKTWEGLGWVPV